MPHLRATCPPGQTDTVVDLLAHAGTAPLVLLAHAGTAPLVAGPGAAIQPRGDHTGGITPVRIGAAPSDAVVWEEFVGSRAGLSAGSSRSPTVPAACYAGVTAILGQWDRFVQTTGRLAVNLVGIVVAPGVSRGFLASRNMLEMNPFSLFVPGMLAT